MTGNGTDGLSPVAVRMAGAPTRLGPLDFAIIGAQKSASTFLQHCLAAHPQVVIPRTESPHFEDPVYGEQSMAALAATLAGAPPGARRGIKRPNYLGLAEVPARLARHAPDAKLVVVLRDPVARAISAYRHYVTAGRIAHAPIDTAFRQLLDGQVDPEHPHAHEILDWGRYGEHLDRYRSHFAAEQMLILLQDDIAADAARAFTQICVFLDIDSGFLPRDLHSRRNVGAQSELHLRLSRVRWQARQSYLADRAVSPRPVSSRLSWPYMAALTALDRFVLPRVPGRLQKPGPATVARLRRYYADDVRKVQDVVHRDLGAWS